MSLLRGVLWLLALSLWAAAATAAEPGPQVLAAVTTLCGEVADGGQPESALVAPLLDYVRQHPKESCAVPSLFRAPGAYHAFSINQPLPRLLRYLYNSQLPEEVVKPFSLRASRWIGPAPDLDQLWRTWPPSGPVMLRGMQEDHTTPDLSTGGCYRMRLDRVLYLLPWGDGQALISVSRQQGESGVGTKGYVVSDPDWAYLYADEEGLTKTGLGWVRSTVQTNVSVAVYLSEPGRPVVNGIFQWMRAGWSGLSVVTAGHVQASLQRYESQLVRVLAALPGPEVLEAAGADLRQLDDATLRERVRPVVEGWLRERPMGSGYVDGLSRGELLAILLQEQVRSAVRKR